MHYRVIVNALHMEVWKRGDSQGVSECFCLSVFYLLSIYFSFTYTYLINNGKECEVGKHEL